MPARFLGYFLRFNHQTRRPYYRATREIGLGNRSITLFRKVAFRWTSLKRGGDAWDQLSERAARAFPG